MGGSPQKRPGDTGRPSFLVVIAAVAWLALIRHDEREPPAPLARHRDGPAAGTPVIRAAPRRVDQVAIARPSLPPRVAGALRLGSPRLLRWESRPPSPRSPGQALGRDCRIAITINPVIATKKAPGSMEVGQSRYIIMTVLYRKESE
jgi:hypothetical protein